MLLLHHQFWSQFFRRVASGHGDGGGGGGEISIQTFVSFVKMRKKTKQRFSNSRARHGKFCTLDMT